MTEIVWEAMSWISRAMRIRSSSVRLRASSSRSRSASFIWFSTMTSCSLRILVSSASTTTPPTTTAQTSRVPAA